MIADVPSTSVSMRLVVSYTEYPENSKDILDMMTTDPKNYVFIICF